MDPTLRGILILIYYFIVPTWHKRELLFQCNYTSSFYVSWPNWPRSKLAGFELAQDHYMINTLFMFEGQIPNDSKVIAFTRNHTDNADEDDDDDGTK